MIVFTIIVMIPLFFLFLLMLIAYFNEILGLYQATHDDELDREIIALMIFIFAITWLIIGMMGWLICQF